MQTTGDRETPARVRHDGPAGRTMDELVAGLVRKSGDRISTAASRRSRLPEE
ncbi:hypothetical protein ACFYXM_06270 [Streptomyces sp. NPDC002476]|uniref:hypothetical protein n=1 Tax=Streptomyces sp. NPDC002476 TaxID=3364648 RepID=UPI0036906B22